MKFKLGKIFPIIESLTDYSLLKSKSDLMAGLLVGIMLVPQAMGYAMLAGLPPIIGLYAGTVPLVIYAVFGTSRHLAVGPVAIISLMVFSACSQLAAPGSADYIQLTIIMAGLSGLILLILGIIRAGFLINFFSDSVIHGFTSAAAIIITASQIPHICGIKVAGQGAPIVKIWEIFRGLADLHLTTLLVGLGCIIVLVVSNQLLPRGIGPFTVVILSTLLVFGTRFDQSGLAIVGSLPQGLPSFGFPDIELSTLQMMMPAALSIAFIGYIESMAVAKLIASKKGYVLDANRELTSLGLSNIAASLFSGYPVTGGFSRSAVNEDIGAHTAVSTIITALVVLLTLLLLTPLFFYMPKAALAAIVIVSVIKLVDLKEGILLYSVQKRDGLAFLITFLATLGVGVEEGILVGLSFSLLMYLWRSSQPYIAEIGFVPEEKIFHDIRRYKTAQVTETMLFIRVEGPLFFANLKFMEDHITKLVNTRTGLERIVIDMSGVFYMDAVAVRRLEQLITMNENRGIETLFSRTRGEIREILTRAGWEEKQLMKKLHSTNIELLQKYQGTSPP